VREIAADYGIAVSTLYEWKHRLEAYMPLLVGVLEANTATLDSFLRGFLNQGQSITSRLYSFYEQYQFPFLKRGFNAKLIQSDSIT